MTAVSFNFRIVRDDGQPISGREVYAVLRFFLGNRREPDGYRIEAVNWRTRKGGRSPRSAQEGRDAMLDHFWAILKVRGIEGMRAGAVKRDRL